jgi:[protein-PII] uridylyltransferase
VRIDNDASASSTVLEVRAPDEVGLLHRVTAALFGCDLDVVSARASTLGDEVVDAFYVRSAAGQKLTDGDTLALVERSVRAAVE